MVVNWNGHYNLGIVCLPVPTDDVFSLVFIESSALKQVVALRSGMPDEWANQASLGYTPKKSCSVVSRKQATASALYRCQAFSWLKYGIL
ncbi:hypothetical protein TNCV_374431 [Trichonephila clavipes]|nr:hypothetical protein TNCV_374431 [Trichonephila clavipes]